MIESWTLDLVPDWTSSAACVGEWEEFDAGDNPAAAMVCWSKCTVREECLASAIRSERRDSRVFGSLAIYGTRGGYTNVERRLVHRVVEQLGFDALESL